MSPLVSVVIPYLNRRHTMRRAVDSVLQQTMQDFEIIVVDDASSDDLAAALSPYAADKRVRSLRHPVNKGPAAARNSGIAAAAGRFVAFLDSDDVWMPEKLGRQSEAVLAASDPDNVFCVTKTRVLLDGGREIIRPLRGPSPGRTLAEYLYLEGGFAQTSCFFLSRSLARRFPFHEDFRQLEDHLFIIEIGASGAQYLLIEEVLTVWSNMSAPDRASSADDLHRWIDIVARFGERAAPHVPPRVLLAGEVRCLSDRLWKTAPAKSLWLLFRGLLSGALSPAQTAALLGRNVLPLRTYNGVRHWLATRRAGKGPANPVRIRQHASHPPTARMPDDRRNLLHPELALPGNRSIVFVTEELFLPPRNGSQQTYATVARSFADAGWTTYCISFFRDSAIAFSSENTQAYRAMFADFLLLPGWNRGGTVLGRLGQVFREADRSLTGNVLSSHPFLITKGRAEIRRIAERIASWDVSTVYVHKVHGMQLLGHVLDALRGLPVILNLHDDFVTRATNYDRVHEQLFAVLPFRLVMRDHASAWVRHRFARTNQAHSRRVEQKLLQRCGTILVGSVQEVETYMADEALAGKIVLSPVIYNPPGCTVATARSSDFDAGFIGSEDVMNLHALLYFRDEILPRVQARFPGFRFLVAGRVGPVARPILEGVGGVTVWNHLDTVRGFYNAVKVAVVPVRYGTGVSVRFLEARKFGRPVVSTTVGVRGLASTSFDDATVTDDPEEFAAAVVARAQAVETVRPGLSAC